MMIRIDFARVLPRRRGVMGWCARKHVNKHWVLSMSWLRLSVKRPVCVAMGKAGSREGGEDKYISSLCERHEGE